MKAIEFNVKLLELNYQRYISRAHTAFEAGSALAIALVLGITETYSKLVEVGVIFSNKYWLIIFYVAAGFIALIVLTIGLAVIQDSRKHRHRIEKEFKKLRDGNFRTKAMKV